MIDENAQHADGPATALSLNDVEAMIRLVAEVCDPTRSLGIAERRELLVRRLTELVGADVWIWGIGQSKPGAPHDSVPFTLLDGGWRSDAERVSVLGACMNQEISGEANRYTAEAFRDMRVRTWMRSDVWTDAQWQATEVGGQWEALGFGHFILSAYPMPELFHSVVGLHRRVGRPPFADRDRTILHVIWQQVEWLHRQELDVPVGSAVVELTLRERQVLMLLLAGKARKEAAAILELSEHTVGDYVKGIYRKLEVSTRGELLARFMPSRAHIGP